MKMVKVNQKFDKKKIRSLLEKENEFITNLFVNFEVPDSVEGTLCMQNILCNTNLNTNIWKKKTNKFNLFTYFCRW